LLLPRCADCQTVIWYPRPYCPACASLNVGWFEASGRGSIYSFTVNRRGQADLSAYREAGTYVLAYVELEEGQNFRKAGSFGPMAGHVNGALGLKMAHPDRTVVVGCGDGCYNLSGFELMTAVQYDIPVIWIVFNDGEFKLIKIFQLSAFHESGLVEFTNPDFVAYAKACGAQGVRVETLEEFEQAFKAAVASGKPTLIDAAITRLAIPHYSPNPDGVFAAIEEALAKRLGVG